MALMEGKNISRPGKHNHIPPFQLRSGIWLLLGLFAAVTAWTYMHKVLLPWEYQNNVKSGKLKQEMGDLYPRWVGTRELLLHGQNPYGPEVSHEIQMAFYGRPIEQKLGVPGADIVDEQRFVYPIYVVFFLAPTVYADFAQVQAWAPVVLALLIAAAVLLWMDVLRWQPPKMLAAAIILFVLASPQTAQGLRLRQIGLVVAFLLAASVWCITRNHLLTAGALLAVSTIKPQMVVLPLACFLLWGAGAWPQRWRFLAGFGIVLALLVGAGEFLLPGWLHYFWEGVLAYREYYPSTSLPRVFLGNAMGNAVSAIAIIAMLILAWKNREHDANSAAFAHDAAIFMLILPLVLPLWRPFDQVLLLLPLMLVLRDWTKLSRPFRHVFALMVAWPSITSVALLIHRPDVNSHRWLPLLPSAFELALPFVVAILCVPKRHFAINPGIRSDEGT
jgi:glycosyl transferase family 87